MDLFNQTGEVACAGSEPLAARMRPRTLDEIVGQEHILGPGKLLRRAIESDRLSSIILFGPPGCGKTSLAQVIATATKRRFERTTGAGGSAVELKSLLLKARAQAELGALREEEPRESGGEAPAGTILFADEIHRFNKAQQDLLLPFVEDGTVTLIGASTHNPMFYVNAPLISRSLVFELKPVREDAVVVLLRRALTEERGLGRVRAQAQEDALRYLASVCEGDVRRALNALEIAVLSTKPGPDGAVVIEKSVVEDSVQKKAVVYDRDEDGHYDTISAFIKSVRGSDPHAAVYWLAKMLHAGEDPRFIVRRLIILASEDIGNADPRGLLMAESALHAVDFVGMPEARIVLSQVTTYLATAPKSNAAYLAIDEALADVQKGRTHVVPRHLRNVKVQSVEPVEEGPERAYVYPHAHEGHFVEQEYVPSAAKYYRPGSQGYEETIRKRMEQWKRL